MPDETPETELHGEFRCAYFARAYEATVDFYASGLGLEPIESWDRGVDDRGTLFAAAAGIIEVLARPREGKESPLWDQRDPAGVTLVIEVENVDSWHERAVERGLDIVQGLVDQHWGHRSLVLRDPNGISLYLFTAR